MKHRWPKAWSSVAQASPPTTHWFETEIETHLCVVRQMGHVFSKEWVLRSTIKKSKQVMGILKPIYVCSTNGYFETHSCLFNDEEQKKKKEKKKKKERTSVKTKSICL